MKKMTREEIIDTLINNDIEIVQSGEANDYLDNVLRCGFVGYEKQTDQELENEINERVEEEIKLVWKLLFVPDTMQ